MSVLDDATIIYVPGVYKTSAVALQKPISAGSVSSLTFARASTGTRVNSAGLIESVATNVPRVDYLNGSCGAQLLEPARTNLILRSEEFDNGIWAKLRTTISANQVVAPDGTTTGDKLVEDTSSNTHLITQIIAGQTSGTTYIVSVFAKAAERTSIKLFNNGGGGGSVIVDLTDGSILSGDGEVEDFGNGWYRVMLEFTPNITGVFNCPIGILSGGAQTYTGDGTSGVYIWGYQIEQGSYATTYIPTVASTVTRTAETLSKTGLASYLGDSEGTIFFEGSFSDVNCGVGLSDGTSNNRVTIGLNASSNLTGSIITAGVIEGVITISGNTGQNYKIAIAYEVNRLVFYVGGVKIGEDNTVNTYAPGTLTRLGFDDRGSNPLYGKVSALHVWDTALTDTQLAELTS